MPGSRSIQRSTAPAPNQRRSAFEICTGRSTSSSSAASTNASAAANALASTSGSTTAKPRSGDHAARSPVTASVSITDSKTTPAGGNDARSRSSGPDTTSRWRAASATVVTIAPNTDVFDSCAPGCGIRPYDGLNPGRPQNAPGMRVEPPPSEAVANGTMPAATAAAEPPLDPPGVRDGFHGLRVTPHAGVAVMQVEPNSGAAVLPIGTAPAARSRATCTESSSIGGRSLYSSDPCDVGRPAQSSRSFTPKGTPAIGPGSSPRATAASTASAAFRARPSSTTTKAFSAGLSASSRARHSSSTSTAVRSLDRTASATAITLCTDTDATEIRTLCRHREWLDSLEGAVMDKRFDWNPTPDEVRAIVNELRPVLADIARRQDDELERIEARQA